MPNQKILCNCIIPLSGIIVGCSDFLLRFSMSGTLRFYVDGILSYERLGVALNMASLPLQCAGRVSASPPSGPVSRFSGPL